MSKYTDIGFESTGHVGLIEIRKPPLNFFDVSLINQIADALEEFDKDVETPRQRARRPGQGVLRRRRLLRSEAQEQEQESKKDPAANLPINHLYVQAVRIFRNKKPIVAAVHGAAIGGGFGLAVAADFRVTCPEARFAANFTKLGFHPGFGHRDASRTGRQEQRRTDFPTPAAALPARKPRRWALPISACRRTRSAPRR